MQSWSKAAIDGTFEPQSLRTPRRTDALKLETQKPHKLDGDENTGSNSLGQQKRPAAIANVTKRVAFALRIKIDL